MTGLINLKLVCDDRLRGTEAETNLKHALNRLSVRVRASSGGKVGVRYLFAYTRFTEGDIEWQGSSFNGHPIYVPSAAWTQRLNDMYDEPNTSVVLVFHPADWKDPDHVIGGINYFQTQVLNPRLNWGVGAWELTIEHELLHSFDNRAAGYDGVSFEEAIRTNLAGSPVRVWDNDVVHENYHGQWVGMFNYVWQRCSQQISTIYPNTEPMVDEAKLRQITNELLMRDPIAGEDDAYIGRPEAEVRAEVGALQERWKIISLVNAARSVNPL